MLKPLLELGYGNFVFLSQVLIILNPESQPTKRIIQAAKSNNNILDVKQGNKTRSVIVLDNGKVILSAKTTTVLKTKYLNYANKINYNKENHIFMEPFLEIGYKNYVQAEKVETILNPNSQPTIRLVKDAKANSRCFDIREGKKTKSVLILNSGDIIVSVIDSKTLRSRYDRYVDKINNNKEVEGDTNE